MLFSDLLIIRTPLQASTIIYNILNTILKEFNIRKNLISITRNNTYILNLVNNTLLDYTFFTINNIVEKLINKNTKEDKNSIDLFNNRNLKRYYL
jgi:hypothetical protein